MKYKQFIEQLNSRAGSGPPSESERFKARIAEIAKNFDGGSLDEFSVKVQEVVESHNRAPRSDFAGLSPDGMSRLLYNPLENGSPVQIRTHIADDVLGKVGFLRLFEELLKIIKRDGYIKLTAKLGALPRRTIVELYDHHFIPQWVFDDGLFKLSHQDDSPVMGTLHGVARLSGLVRKVHGKLVLTKLGEKMLSPKSRKELFGIVFSAFTTKFNWAYNDLYPDFPLCREAVGFSVYLVARFADEETDKDFYAEKFLNAFPWSLDEFQGDSWGTPESSFKTCYRLRTFERFLEWFNLVDVRPNEQTHVETHQQSLVKKSEIMDKIFVLT